MPFSRIHGFKIILTLQIGEGAFGEVFLLSTDSFPVLKIVAVDGSSPVNGQPPYASGRALHCFNC